MPKAQVYIKNLSIKNIPTRSNRIFLKIKSGQKSLTTNKHQIDQNNSVTFENMITIQNSIKKTKKGNTMEKIRFSFRIEKSNGVDFTRYGCFNITNLDFDQTKSHPYHINRSLERCKEKPLIECEIIVVDHSKNSIKEAIKPIEQKQSTMLEVDQSDPVFNKTSLEPHISDMSSKSDPRPINNQLVINIDKARNSISVSSMSFSSPAAKSIPLNMTEKKYNEIEKEIDDLLADIINE